ncbi:Nitrite reductase (NAD(P)H) large subunit [Methylophaga frappieri]|uniref:Nitrite reductase (NAD(P)H) large subunit n=1 Tax=Methylophaga frappieri (strain ATCC BAA-2434 / DSM 25690 / JAM7) TaxID=754477 RepID=I1YH31_METFJ|nr:nitrite reductase large subunit NirB [Methylophaga frappieri]AFJ02224.1 Nitrite reductase (NAD(P)H) large subunit [Methylophaga frappieri]
MKEKLVLIGNGMAGMRTLEELLKLAPDRYQITVFGDEPYGNYNRIMLSPVLAGEKTIDEIMINDLQWYEDNNVTLYSGQRVTKIDRMKRRVITDDGLIVEYDRLLLATGSRPFMLPLPGADLPGVISFRDIADVDTMIETAKTHKKAVVIGGGLLGLEAANGLMIQGMDVSVVHISNTLMNQQLDQTASDMMQAQLTDKGLNFLMGHASAAIEGTDRVERLVFKDGSHIDTDLVVMAVGIRPSISLAQSAGIHCERGIVVDDTMQTFDPRIYAVGECVQHRGDTFGLVAPLFEQAKVCANHLAQMGIARYMSMVTSTKLKVTGIDLFSAGDFQGDEDSEDLIFKDAARNVYKKLVIKKDQLIGSVLYGDTVDGAWYFQLMRDGTDVSELRETMLFGQHHMGDSGHGASNSVDGLPDNAEICGCNGVCKGDIVQAITKNNLFTLDEVKAQTKAAASCGSCTGLVEQLLASTLGSDFNETPSKKAMCGCTHLSHNEVKAAIKAQNLKTIPDVMTALEWQQPDGCHSCRPALNYYLLSSWPNEYVDDQQSRFINERVHANIQKDGTYSVVPRIWGGVTNPGELRAIADISEKYQVPTVKITGGQRIDLLGVKKDDLPKMWSDLSQAGFVSGHAYGKSLRTVKTCVGSEWCRFGTQDSTGLGIKVEKMTWGSWTPHKFKIAVSGCPRNCAEATIKDFGIVCVDSGYELHVGGNGGIKVRATDFLCKVKTEEEAMEYCAAFMQLYREDGHYLERTAPWIERVGLKSVQAQVVDDEANRKQLAQRFYDSQKNAQNDPWAEEAAKQPQKYIPIKQVS